MEVKFNRSANPASSGFTIIEVVVIITIISIISASALLRWSTSSTGNADAQRLAADIRYTQSLAMTHGKRYRLTITPPNTYAITLADGTAVKSLVSGNTTSTLSTGVTFGALSNLPNNMIGFDGLGRPYTDAAISTLLSTTASINFTSEGVNRRITINPNGKVSVG